MKPDWGSDLRTTDEIAALSAPPKAPFMYGFLRSPYSPIRSNDSGGATPARSSTGSAAVVRRRPCKNPCERGL